MTAFLHNKMYPIFIIVFARKVIAVVHYVTLVRILVKYWAILCGKGNNKGTGEVGSNHYN